VLLILAAAVFMYWLVLWADSGLIRQMTELDRRNVEWDKYDTDIQKVGDKLEINLYSSARKRRLRSDSPT
jgi:hypothetical protein